MRAAAARRSDDFANVAVKSRQLGAANQNAYHPQGDRARRGAGQPYHQRAADHADVRAECRRRGRGGAVQRGVRAPARRQRPVFVRSCAVTSGIAGSRVRELVERAAATAPTSRPRLGPRDVDVIELHDATTPAELWLYEMLGLCGANEGPELVRNGDDRARRPRAGQSERRHAVRGHPVGASGVAQVCELADQLRGRVRRAAEGRRARRACRKQRRPRRPRIPRPPSSPSCRARSTSAHDAPRVGLTFRLSAAARRAALRERFPAVAFAGPGLEPPHGSITSEAEVLLGWPKPDFVRAAQVAEVDPAVRRRDRDHRFRRGDAARHRGDECARRGVAQHRRACLGDDAAFQPPARPAAARAARRQLDREEHLRLSGARADRPCSSSARDRSAARSQGGRRRSACARSGSAGTAGRWKASIRLFRRRRREASSRSGGPRRRLRAGQSRRRADVNVAWFRRMKPGAYFYNVGRGNTVDESALLHALDDGHIAGAGLDVTGVEPLPPGHPFWTHPKVLLTQHKAMNSGRYWERLTAAVRRQSGALRARQSRCSTSCMRDVSKLRQQKTARARRNKGGTKNGSIAETRSGGFRRDRGRRGDAEHRPRAGLESEQRAHHRAVRGRRLGRCARPASSRKA